jgi:hypothetical protein
METTLVVAGSVEKVFLDISDALWGLADGTYTVTLSFPVTSWTYEPSPPFNLVGMRPDQSEALRTCFQELKPADLPRQAISWVRALTNGKHEQPLPKELSDQLAPYLFVAKAANVGEVAKAPTEELVHLPAHLQALANLWRYEIFLSRGERNRANEVKNRARSEKGAAHDYFTSASRNEGMLKTIILQALRTP